MPVAMFFLEEGDRGFDLLGAQFNPLATYLDKRNLQADQILKFFG